MKALSVAGWMVLVAGAAFAQHRGAVVGGGAGIAGHRGFSNYGSSSGFGNVVFPGTGRPPVAGFSITDPGFASRLGATVGGYPAYNGAPVGAYGYSQGRRPVVYVPYAYPVYTGGYEYGYQQQPNVTIIYPSQPTPQVIINQTFTPDTARPMIQEYPQATSSDGIRVYQAPSRPATEPAASNESRYYLIAFKDHSVYSALGYWVEGETLHYLTAENSHNQASLDLVDRELTQKLNRDRNVEVRLPR